MTVVAVFDPQRTAAPLRARLRASLQPDEVAWMQETGALAVACTAEVERAEADGAFCLFEGRLYNGEELAPRLGVPLGLGASTLVLRGYEQLGPELWPLLRGDFVLAVWDSKVKCGAIVRDQLGGRALYLRRAGGVVALATELRNLVELLPSRPPPDEVAVAHWLLPSVLPEDRTFFAGVEEVPPATRLSLGAGGVQAERYWMPRYRRQRGLSLEEASARSRELLVQAVERRAEKAEESAILLSGGIDSASVAGISCGLLPLEQRPRCAYSAIFPRHPEIDEAALISSVASHNGLEATGIEVEAGGLLAASATYMETWQTPPPTPNLSFLRPLLDRAAADGVRVLQDGEGGDAIFWFSAPLVAERLRRGRLLSAWSLAGSFPEYGVPTTWRTRIGNLRRWGRPRDFSPSPQPWLAVDPALLEADDRELSAAGPAWWRDALAGVLGPGSRMAHDITRRNGALSGIEPRHPLLDVDLIEGVLSFPPELAFERRFNRPVLREAVAGLVPDEVRLRPYKSNFDPVFIASTDADLPIVEGLLLSPAAHLRAYTSREALATHIASPPQSPAARRVWAMSLWHLATLECWLRLQAGEALLPAGSLRSIGPPGYSFSRL